MYERLAVAAADLNEDDRRRVLESDVVEKIFRNEIRRFPPCPISTAEPQITSIEEAAGDPHAAYLLGMRDATQAALRHYKSRTVELPPNRRAPRAGTSINWNISMIGVSGPRYGFTGKGVKVAVLDTGIDMRHPDFQDRFVEGVNAVSFVPGEGPQDANGHGTHCCGIVAGPAQNRLGRRYSVAPRADLLVGKVLGDDGYGTDDGILDGIAWAEEQGARIISMSLGSERSAGGAYSTPYERIAGNLLLGDPGVLLVAAAGNGSNRPHWTKAVENPAACPSIMAVAAIDDRKNVAFFSSRKKDPIGLVDLSAPGVAIVSATTGGGYESLSGTSMATPHVAGVAALNVEKKPEIAARDLWARLLRSAASLGDSSDYGAGLAVAPR
ncbi:MAG: S8 family serine peptidase [Deltaproteobacteria bacterium]|nr:S8 family serine peptidase [Deltaproteobacteria bacterium]